MIQRFDVREMPADLYKKCFDLNLGSTGSMRWKLKDCRSGDHKGKAYVIAEGDVVLSWALVFKRPGKYDYGHWTAYFYTRKSCRRTGLGTLLARRIRRDYSRVDIVVDPWDENAAGFFESVELPRRISDRKML